MDVTRVQQQRCLGDAPAFHRGEAKIEEHDMARLVEEEYSRAALGRGRTVYGRDRGVRHALENCRFGVKEGRQKGEN